MSSMQTRLLTALCAATVAIVSPAFGQSNVSAAVSGLITDSTGKPLAGAKVTMVHTPTGTTYTTETSSTGRYNFSGVQAGGPYTVTADAAGFRSTIQQGLTAQLGETIDASLKLPPADVVVMDKFEVTGEINDLDSASTGAGSVLDSNKLATAPTVMRSFADMARTNPFVQLRGILVTRQMPAISAVGQNNRFNSIQVDGARINDQFGLNGSGLQSFGNPISLDALEQMNVAISPYDPDHSGFTGVSINAVTKSGTNEFKGSAYYYYTNDDLQGPDVFGSGRTLRAKLLQKTYGYTAGGPIIKNHLFFFANYEKYSSITSDTATVDPTATAQGQSDLARVLARGAAINTATGKSYNFGTFDGRTAALKQADTKKLFKLDWNATATQRFSIRYTKVNGELPQAGKYSQTTTLNPLSTANGFSVATTNIAGLNSNGYNQVRNEETVAAQLFSQWTSRFKTELQWSKNRYNQATPVNTILPEIRIFGFSGLNKSGTTVNGNGVLVLGTEQNRQGNFVAVDTSSQRANAQYTLSNLHFSVGYDRETSKFVNLFRSSSYGQFDFANVTDFENDVVRNFLRSTYLKGTPKDEKSDFGVSGLYGQMNWSPSARFSTMVGLRYDWFTADKRPPLNAASNPNAATDFVGVFGLRNDGSVDGATLVSPRFNFNLGLNQERTLQLRGGIGHFTGRIPWVIMSNSFGNSGVGRSTTRVGVTSLVNYLKGPTDAANPQLTFDAADPIGTTASAAVGVPTINLATDKLKPPSVWRSNLALEKKLPFWSSTFTLEGIHTKASKALYIRNFNLKPRFVGSDGRQVYSGSTSTAPLHPEFGDVLATTNIKMGYSTYVSAGLKGAIAGKYSYDVTYTRGKARDAIPLGETVAFSQFTRNPVFNQNTPTMARSAFEVANRIQASLSRDFRYFKGYKTNVSLYYEGKTGNPFSVVYSNDANGDGTSGNDVVYVPNGMTDPVILASISNGMSTTVAQQIVNYADNSMLTPFKGGIVPRYGLTMPWVNRLDLHLAQEIPIYKPAYFEVFADFVNFGSWFSKRIFGYMETIQGTGDNDLFANTSFGSATYLATGQLVMTGSSFTRPVEPTPDNNQTRWRIQLGGRLKF
jgi:hypothetical protein